MPTADSIIPKTKQSKWWRPFMKQDLPWQKGQANEKDSENCCHQDTAPFKTWSLDSQTEMFRKGQSECNGIAITSILSRQWVTFCTARTLRVLNTVWNKHDQPLRSVFVVEIRSKKQQSSQIIVNSLQKIIYNTTKWRQLFWANVYQIWSMLSLQSQADFLLEYTAVILSGRKQNRAQVRSESNMAYAYE